VIGHLEFNGRADGFPYIEWRFANRTRLFSDLEGI